MDDGLRTWATASGSYFCASPKDREKSSRVEQRWSNPQVVGSIPTQVRDFSLSLGGAQKKVPDAVDHQRLLIHHPSCFYISVRPHVICIIYQHAANGPFTNRSCFICYMCLTCIVLHLHCTLLFQTNHSSFWWVFGWSQLTFKTPLLLTGVYSITLATISVYFSSSAKNFILGKLIVCWMMELQMLEQPGYMMPSLKVTGWWWWWWWWW